MSHSIDYVDLLNTQYEMNTLIRRNQRINAERARRRQLNGDPRASRIPLLTRSWDEIDAHELPFFAHSEEEV
jgi:hypothetical protein